MSEHPYKSFPDTSFWSRAVANGRFAPQSIVTETAPLLEAGEKVASAGSCFASNVVPYLEPAGFPYVRTEMAHPNFNAPPNPQYGYHAFSAAYGHIYTTRQLKQLLLRALGRFKPVDDRFHQNGEVVDAFRPGLQFNAWSDREFDLLTRQHLDYTLDAIRQADVFIFTLGLTECWASAKDGAVYPACPGTIAGAFDAAAHVFVNLTSSEVRSEVGDIVGLMREINPKIRLILTVSPVPLVATATPRHVVPATIYSKSALVCAAVEASGALAGVRYFPSYEIITGPQAPESFFEADRRNVSAQGIETVMAVLLAHTAAGAAQPAAPPPAPDVQALAEEIVRIECEEMAADRR
ncbi:GSCFA domain-containing protein [Terricaulis sp.]|uniref:GSCFA domain-containing protein n=1 Tax=Terricaulis sp. TaxID=2768686 RepID=UPI00378336BF